MGKNLATKLAIIVAVLLFFVYGIIGPHSTDSLHDNPLQALAKNINLGLDLKGGTHLVLAVQVVEAVNSATDRDVQRIESALATAGITGPVVAKPDATTQPGVILIANVTPAQSSQVRSLLNTNEYAQYDVTGQPDGSLKVAMKLAAINDLETRTLDTSIEVIRSRVDKLGVSEPLIQKYGLGENQILVELPGVSDPGRVEEVIQSTAKLEIHAVDGAAAGYDTEAAALAAQPGGVLPTDDYLVSGVGQPGAGKRVYVLKRASEVEGTDFRDAQPGSDINGRPNIKFTLTTEAGDRFYKYTDSHKEGGATPGSMAIVLQDEVREVAGIRDAIRDQGQIDGGFTQEQANDLSMLLRTGALPASIKYTETRTVGPSLGAASIREGVTAAIAGMAAVMIFMLIYYKGSGVNADLALLLNLIILLGYMGWTGAVLTLPGIAGVILTIGMGVDSNVLIFERIREELRAGKTAAAAVKEGFGHAWTTIVDTHVTTIVSALILLMFGTGPVKGFAVTLMVGLFANLLTAVFVSRMIFDWHLQDRPKESALSI
jgi:preprotein translocase subunit SecD